LAVWPIFSGVALRFVAGGLIGAKCSCQLRFVAVVDGAIIEYKTKPGVIISRAEGPTFGE
jgi:hypothetical protein